MPPSCAVMRTAHGRMFPRNAPLSSRQRPQTSCAAARSPCRTACPSASAPCAIWPRRRRPLFPACACCAPVWSWASCAATLLPRPCAGALAAHLPADGGFPGRRPGDCRLSARRDAARHAARLDAADGRRAFAWLGTRCGRHSKESVSKGPAPSALTASLAFSPPYFRFSLYRMFKLCYTRLSKELSS